VRIDSENVLPRRKGLERKEGVVRWWRWKEVEKKGELSCRSVGFENDMVFVIRISVPVVESFTGVVRVAQTCYRSSQSGLTSVRAVKP
jgi:hypothetical protein